MTPTVRALSVAGLAAGLALAGCGGSGTPGAGHAGNRTTTTVETNALPEPGEPALRLDSDDFPITVRPVGVETSPTIGDTPSDPGETELGVVLEYRGSTRDRPTPMPGNAGLREWTVLYPPPKGEQCQTFLDVDGLCADDEPSHSAVFDERTANRQGIRIFNPTVIEEDVEGDTEDTMAPGTGYFVELFNPIPESVRLADITLCATPPSHDPDAMPAPRNCFRLGDLPELPERR